MCHAALRDSSGNFRAASARWLSHVGSALIAEAEAIRDEGQEPESTS
jgi:hypothetical protein